MDAENAEVALGTLRPSRERRCTDTYRCTSTLFLCGVNNRKKERLVSAEREMRETITA
jgi:hypothetical protein